MTKKKIFLTMVLIFVMIIGATVVYAASDSNDLDVSGNTLSGEISFNGSSGGGSTCYYSDDYCEVSIDVSVDYDVYDARGFYIYTDSCSESAADEYYVAVSVDVEGVIVYMSGTHSVSGSDFGASVYTEAY